MTKINCTITKFDLPDMMWVGYPRKAELSTNSVCETGKITCKLEDGTDCTGKETLSGEAPVGPLKTKEFTINEAGYYEYEFTACGPNNCDTWGDGVGLGDPGKPEAIQAINLPIWQEINPVLPDKLQGFLRGIWE